MAGTRVAADHVPSATKVPRPGTFHDCRLVAQLLERPPDGDPRHSVEHAELLFAREWVPRGQRPSGDLVVEDQVELVVERHAPGDKCHASTLANSQS